MSTGQTDGRTADGYITLSAMDAVSVMNTTTVDNKQTNKPSENNDVVEWDIIKTLTESIQPTSGLARPYNFPFTALIRAEAEGSLTLYLETAPAQDEPVLMVLTRTLRQLFLTASLQALTTAVLYLPTATPQRKPHHAIVIRRQQQSLISDRLVENIFIGVSYTTTEKCIFRNTVLSEKAKNAEKSERYYFYNKRSLLALTVTTMYVISERLDTAIATQDGNQPF